MGVGPLPALGGDEPEGGEKKRVFRLTTGTTTDLEMLEWSPARKWCAHVLKSVALEITLGILIGFSFLLVIVEADNIDNPPSWVIAANNVLLAIYTLEVAMRIFVLRSRYFCSAMNILDFTIVVSDIISEIIGAFSLDVLPSLVALRVFRLLRLTRSLKIMVKFPQLALLVKGLANALSAVLYGCTMVVVFLLFWSVCAVHFIHPVNQRVSQSGAYGDCARCERAFESVMQSMLTFVQQIIAGDSWGQVTIPIIEEAPATGLFFICVFVSIHLTLLNVILAVIVDTALKTSQEALHEIARQKHEDFSAAARKLKRLCREMDADGSGDISHDELVDGFDTIEEFRDHLEAMDIKKDDMNVVFSIMDVDGSGSVNYDEFISELFKMKSHDSHTLLVFIKHYVMDIRKDLQARIHDLGKKVCETLTEQESRRSSRISDPGITGAVIGGHFYTPVDTPVEEKQKKDPPPVVLAHGEPSQYLWEELRNLRTTISDELVCSMKEFSRKAESHTCLLASIAGDTALLRSDSGVMTPALQLAATEGRLPALSGRELPKPRCSAAGGGALLQGAGQFDGVGLSQREEGPSSVETRPASAWAIQKCCSAQKPRVIHLAVDRLKEEEQP